MSAEMLDNHSQQTGLEGEIVHWNDVKGYGFIHVTGRKDNLFFHISAFAYQNRRPQKGDEVLCLTETQQGKLQAKRVVLKIHADALHSKYAQDQFSIQPHITEALIYGIIVLFFYAVLAFTSLPLAISSIIISMLTAGLYGIDKFSALRGGQRIPEASMHIAAMLGGWPGALLARPLLRHKTTKTRFIIFFWLSILIYFFCLHFLVLYAPQFLNFGQSS